MNKTNNKIQGIKININGVDIEISLAAARELYQELDSLFGQPNYTPINIPQPYKKVDDSGWGPNVWYSASSSFDLKNQYAGSSVLKEIRQIREMSERIASSQAESKRFLASTGMHKKDGQLKSEFR